jgi:hypothetical protein
VSYIQPKHRNQRILKTFTTAAAYAEVGTVSGAAKMLGVNKSIVHREITQLKAMISGTWAAKGDKFWKGMKSIADLIETEEEVLDDEMMQRFLIQAFGPSGKDLLRFVVSTGSLVLEPVEVPKQPRRILGRVHPVSTRPQKLDVDLEKQGPPVKEHEDPRALSTLEDPVELAKMMRFITRFRDQAFVAWEVLFRAAVDVTARPPVIRDKKMFRLFIATFGPEAVMKMQDMAANLLDPDAVSGEELRYILGRVQTAIMDRVGQREAASILGELASAVNELGARRGSQIIDLRSRARKIAQGSADARDQVVQAANTARKQQDDGATAAGKDGPAVPDGQGG